MNREELSWRLLALAALGKLIAAEEAKLKAEGAGMFRATERSVGVFAGAEVGSVQMVRGSSTWGVADAEAWLAWVQKHRPEEIVPSVRPSFQRATLDLLARLDSLVDEEGECFVPDGLVPRHGAPRLRVTPNEEAPQVVLNALGRMSVTLGLAEQGEIA